MMAAAGATRAEAGIADPPSNADALGFGCYDQVSGGCLQAALAAFDKARAREGLGPMTLPVNFTALTPAEQLLVLTNIDRVDRGLVPIAGIASALQERAQQGADIGRDPDFPSWAREGGSNWFGASGPLAAEYFFVYDDGPGSSNIDCTAGNSSGCWGHRHNILGDWHRPLLMGGAVGQGGLTQLLLGSDTHDSADVFRWSDELAYFPVGAPSAPVVVNGSATVPVWASGRAMTISASVSGAGWSIAQRHCRLAAGQKCSVRVTHRHGVSAGRLTLRGPNGAVTVRLKARAARG